jgi:hypothetical protein
MNILQRLEQGFDGIEDTLVNLVSKFGPWLAPAPTAWLIFFKVTTLLGFPQLVGIIAGVVIEILGLASVSTALTLREYNATRRKVPKDWKPSKGNPKYRGKVDPKAPFNLALALVSVYFVSVIVLTVLLELAPQAGKGAMLLFPFLSLCGATILAIRADHRRRINTIAQPKTKTSAQSSAQNVVQSSAQGSAQVKTQVQPNVQTDAQGSVSDAQGSTLEQVNRTRKMHKEQLLNALESAYQDNPNLGATAASRLLGIHRNTVYNYRKELIAQGRISDNGANQ